MADFANLKALAVTRETTKEYFFDMIEGVPSVISSAAHDDNEDYLNARLELALADVPDAGDKGPASLKVTVDSAKRTMAEGREIDRKVIAKACMRGWGTPPIDTDGNPVEFTPENALDFLQAIPDFMFDNYRNYLFNIRNFVPKPKPKGDQLGKS